MLFWDLIRDFFVRYIFGGSASDGEYFGGFIGYITTHGSNGNWEDGLYRGGDTYININGLLTDGQIGVETVGVAYISIGDWLSTTATIISMVGICIGLFMLVRWFFKIGAGLIRLR